MEKHLNQIAYEIAKEEFKNNVFSFDDLWNKVVKYIKVSVNDQPELKGHFYSEIIQDAEFLYSGNQNWRLREFVSQGDIKNIQNLLYDFDKEILDEDMEEIDLLSEKFDESNGAYFDEDEEEVYENMNEIKKEKEQEEQEDILGE